MLTRAPSTARKTPAAAQHDHDSDSIDSEDETHMAPAGTTEGLAQRLLKPKVQATEAAEYQSYVDQYRNLNLSNELVYESSAGDLQMYERAVALCSGEQGSAILVDQASIEAYEKHCRLHRFQAESSLRDSTPSHAPAWDRSSDSEET
ncbi:phosphatidylinositol-3,5-bisphosphate 5-phosphatase [Cystobasidiomycetes sp. EMM_F5]